MIASLKLDAISAQGETFVVTVEIGAPYFREDQDNWACPCTVMPLFKNLREAIGGDSFQSLCLAIRLTQTLLLDFVEKGGALLSDEEPYPFEAYGLGPFT